MTDNIQRIVICTGGFDPLHSGHIAYFKESKKLGDKLFVGLNSDKWLSRKKGMPFLNYDERKTIVEALEVVDGIIEFNDDDNTACDAIEQILHDTENNVIFANGGDRNNTSTPEYQKYYDHPKVDFAFGIGSKEKKNSSSWILDKWKTNRNERDWGYWRVLDDKQPAEGLKVKELVIHPGSSLSDQRHKYRSEFWYILQGSVMIELEFPDGQQKLKELTQHTTCLIKPNWWHKTTNSSNIPAHIIEVQYGETCIEEDIERR